MSSAVLQRSNPTNFQSKPSYCLSQRVKKNQPRITSPTQYDSSSLKCSDQGIRKSNKPLMEKKRRQRINRSLDELKKLITDPQRKDSYSKLEKADILDMTVKYIRTMNQNRCDTETQLIFNSFLAGFGACEHLTFNYLASNQSLLSVIPNSMGFFTSLKTHVTREKEMATLRYLHSQSSSRTNSHMFTPNQLFIPSVNQFSSPNHQVTQKAQSNTYSNFPPQNPLCHKQTTNQQMISPTQSIKSPVHYSAHQIDIVSLDTAEISPPVSLNGSTHSCSSGGDSQSVWRPW